MDFITANCGNCTELEFEAYTFSCDVEDDALQALGFALCGNSVSCPTVEADYTTLIGNSQFVVIKGVNGSKADPTPNEIDLSAYSCLPSKTVKDYTETLNFSVPMLRENWKFWNQIRGNPDIVEQAFYATKSGVVYEIPSQPTITVAIGQNDGIRTINGSLEWITTNLEEPFQALSSIWGC
jgi:hypothetical protein